MNILGLFPLTGNGGIASWTKKFLATFPDDDYVIIPVSNSPAPRSGNDSVWYRFITGVTALIRIMKEVCQTFRSNYIDVLHTTTSGSYGSLRDIIVALLAKNFGAKSIMHCRYGCIAEDYQSHNLVGAMLRLSMRLYDQIWVLDQRSFAFLSAQPKLRERVCLTPNSIDITSPMDMEPKTYSRVAFVGNLIPSKGVYELVAACVETDVRLDIIGPGDGAVINKISELAADKLNQTIFIHGKLPNAEAVDFMRQVDILALPTYYPWEAFPISIIEAMSLSKLVISCPRAAIVDMLTDLNGAPCGLLVEAKSAEAIADAIRWLQTHSQEADSMCKKAYEKAYACYRKEIVYKKYKENYNKLLLAK